MYAVEADFHHDGDVDDDDKDMMANSFFTDQSCGQSATHPASPIECPISSCTHYPDLDP
jgi:hypothetical protein